MNERHIPVLAPEVCDNLALEKGMVCADLTLGDGGHAEHILRRIGEEGRLVAVDQDTEALTRAKGRLKNYEQQIQFIHANFSRAAFIESQTGFKAMDAVVLDLGMSTLQLGSPARGFAIQHSGPLDMRMDTSLDVTAEDIIAEWSEEDLANIFYIYGQERYSRAIARRIVELRRSKRFDSTRELALCIRQAVRAKAHERIHPATRVFQAIRIVVNSELEVLADALPEWSSRLSPGGRLAVISYHSLEDGCAKAVFRDLAKQGTHRLITPKPLVPSTSEIRQNPKARCAKLRIVEKIRHD